MREIEHFVRLLDAAELPRHLDLVQLSPRWREEPEWIDVRDRIDALIFSQLLDGAPLRVRRIVCLEIPREEGNDPMAHRILAGEHRRWIEGLVRDLYYLGEPAQGNSARYRIKQLILGQQHEKVDAVVGDGWGGGSVEDPVWSEAFARTWSLSGCIENNLLPPDYPVGPAGDRDPRWYLWH